MLAVEVVVRERVEPVVTEELVVVEKVQVHLELQSLVQTTLVVEVVELV
jgi:hypothetical protein|tara:strand:+ start:1190 stop:1336 length:147 start_codon:yes stop_codon:yes gene_type:complete